MGDGDRARGAVWLNGSFVGFDDARVSAFDAGLQHAVGLFETMHAVGGNVFRLGAHMQRLRDSARALNLSEDLHANALAQAVALTVERSGLQRARVRLTITGGDLNLLTQRDARPADPTILIVASPRAEYPPEMYEKGVLATVADRRVNPFDPFEGHKTLNYWPRLRDLQIASTKGAAEAIVLQVSNHLAGGAVSNLFLVRDGRLLTPPARGQEEPGAIPSPVLPGVTRDFVLEEAGRIGLETDAKMLDMNGLLDADEAFLTNASWGVLPVVRVERETIGEGTPGPVTMDLLSRWRTALERAPGGDPGAQTESD